jgi:hypothetical protein
VRAAATENEKRKAAHLPVYKRDKDKNETIKLVSQMAGSPEKQGPDAIGCFKNANNRINKNTGGDCI